MAARRATVRKSDGAGLGGRFYIPGQNAVTCKNVAIDRRLGIYWT